MSTWHIVRVLWPIPPCAMQVLGRNLEALVTRAQEIKANWRDEFVSVEHMLLAFFDDAKFGTGLLKDAGLDKPKIESAVKEIRGSNRVTDQVFHHCHSHTFRSVSGHRRTMIHAVTHTSTLLHYIIITASCMLHLSLGAECQRCFSQQSVHSC